MRFTGTTRLIDLSEDRIESFSEAVHPGEGASDGVSGGMAPKRIRAPGIREAGERRARIFQRILGDAGRGAREYVERFKAGRGAE